MILGTPSQAQMTQMQPPQSPSPGAPAYAGNPVPQQQISAAAPQTSPLVQALMGAQGQSAMPQQQSSSPLGGLPLGALASLLGPQAQPQGPTYTGATGPYGNATPGGLPVGGGAAQYP